jgi:cob(I)alamin adenosyltransferase
MSIRTKRGDGVQTGLIGGVRVSKADVRVEAYGCADELKSVLGFARSICQDPEICSHAEAVQKTLFRLGAVLASAPATANKTTEAGVTSADVDQLTDLVHKIETAPGILSDWSLPGQTRRATQRSRY